MNNVRLDAPALVGLVALKPAQTYNLLGAAHALEPEANTPDYDRWYDALNYARAQGWTQRLTCLR